MRWRIATVALGVAVAACSPTVDPPVTTTSAGPSTSSTRPPSDEFCLAGDLPFEREGLVTALGDDAGDATSITQIRWDVSANCERMTITFGASSGAPAATLGPSAVSIIPYAGTVRVGLPPEIVQSALADTLLEGPIVDSAVVVRDLDGVMFVDIRGTEEVAIEARAFTTTSPATLVVDLIRADTAATPVGISATDAAIVLTPTPGASRYPMVVEGHVRPGLPAIRLQLRSADTTPVDRSISMPGYTDTWQSFATTIERGPVGSAVLFVGTLDGDGRPDEGTIVSVIME